MYSPCLTLALACQIGRPCSVPPGPIVFFRPTPAPATVTAKRRDARPLLLCGSHRRHLPLEGGERLHHGGVRDPLHLPGGGGATGPDAVVCRSTADDNIQVRGLGTMACLDLSMSVKVPTDRGDVHMFQTRSVRAHPNIAALFEH